jgi:hypothetical protein
MKHMEQFEPTADADINEMLYALLSGISDILKEQLVGVYLYGSLASGGFDSRSSDVDFAVATLRDCSETCVRSLGAMHQQLWDGNIKWAYKLEGSYVPVRILRKHGIEGSYPCPTVNEGRFYTAPLGSDWIIQRYVLREMGVVVWGPHPNTLIEPVAKEDLFSSVHGFLEDWWAPMLSNPERLKDPDYQVYAVLSMCRALYTLQTGGLASKNDSAQWAKTHLDRQWGELIDWAISSQVLINSNRFSQVVNFIRFVVAFSRGTSR